MSLEVARLRANAHPLRLQMLSLLTGAAMSAAEIARELDITQANASYHLRVLAAAGLVEEAGEERIRGGVAKRYRHPWQRDTEEAKTASDPEAAIVLAQAMASELMRRVQWRKPKHSEFCDAEVWLEPEVWKRASELGKELAILVHEHAKPPRTEGTEHVNVSMALFEMAEPDDPAGGSGGSGGSGGVDKQ